MHPNAACNINTLAWRQATLSMLNDARALYTQNRAEQSREVKKKSINEWSINKSWDTLLSPYWEWHSDTTDRRVNGERFLEIPSSRAFEHWRWAWEQKGIIKINILFLSIVILVFFFLPRSSRALYQKSLCVSFTSSTSFVFFFREEIYCLSQTLSLLFCALRADGLFAQCSRRKHFGKCNKNTTAKK